MAAEMDEREERAVAKYMACYRDKGNTEALHFMREEKTKERVSRWEPAVILSQGECEAVRRAELKYGTLAEAAAFGDRATVHALLSAGVAASGVEGGCALIDAARHGHTECVQDLLAAGAQATGLDGAKALGLATSAEVRNLLRGAGADPVHALAHAVRHGRREVSIALLGWCTVDALLSAHDPVFRKISTDLVDRFDRSFVVVSAAAVLAAQCGHGRLVRELIRMSALPPSEALKRCALHVAAERGRADDVAAFLQLSCSHDELRPVMRAAVSNGHYAVMQTLRGADARVAPSVAPGEDEENLRWRGLCAAAEAGRSIDVLQLQVLSGERMEKLEEVLRAALSAGRVADFEFVRHHVANFRVEPELVQHGIWHAAFQDRLDDAEKLIGLSAEVSYGGRHVWRRVQRLRAQSPPELLTASVQSAALRAWGENSLPDRSVVSTYGFAARGITLLQLYMLCDQLRSEHFRSGSTVQFDNLTTKQMVEAYLKRLTSGHDACGCPGCAMYDVADYADAVQICPGPHRPHCNAHGPCEFYKCCAKFTATGTEGYCVGCSGSGISVADWIQGGKVPAQYFASHSWGQSFAEDVESFKHFAVAACSRHEGGQGLCPRCEGTSFWVCALAINQHEPLSAQILGGDGEKATERCIKATRGIVLLLDQKLQPFGRVWCLFEIFLAVRDNIRLDVLTSGGCPTRNQGFDPEIIERIRQGIEAIDVSAATSFDPNDRDHIHSTIQRDLGQSGLQVMEQRVKDRLLRYFAPAEAAAKIVQAVREGSAARLREALRCRPGSESANMFDPDTNEPLLQVAARRGDVACVDILVQEGANVQRAGSALVNVAVQHGSSALVLTLLDKRASLEACDACIHRMARMHLRGQPSASEGMDADERLLTIAGLDNPIASGKVSWQPGTGALSLPVVGTALARFFEKAPTLETMNLSSTGLTQAALEAFAESAPENLALTSVSLSRNSRALAGREGGAALAQLVAKAPRLEALDIRETDLTETALQAFAESAPENLALTSVSLSRNSRALAWREGGAALAQLVAKAPRLEALDIKYTGLTETALQAFAESAPGNLALTSMHVSGNSVALAVGGAAMAQLLVKAPQLVFTGLGELALQVLAKSAPPENLAWTSISLSEDGLTRISLSGDGWALDRQEGAMALALDFGSLGWREAALQAFAENGPEKLALTNVSLCWPASGAALAQLLAKAPRLEALDIRRTGLTESALQAFAESTLGNLALTSMDLPYNRALAGREGGAALAQLLVKAPRLEALNIQYTGLTESALQAFAESASENLALTRISLSENSGALAGQVGSAALAQLVAKAPRLVKLDIRLTGMTSAAWQAFTSDVPASRLRGLQIDEDF